MKNLIKFELRKILTKRFAVISVAAVLLWSIPVAIALVVIGSIISHKAFSKHQVR